MDEKVKRNIHYECPNGCPKTWFFENGTSSSSRTLTEDGELMEMEGKYYNFTPNTPVRCYKCRADAIVRTKLEGRFMSSKESYL